MGLSLGGLATAGAAASKQYSDTLENERRFDMQRELLDLQKDKQIAVELAKEERAKTTRIAEGAEVEEAAKGLSGENAPTYDNYITAKQQRGLLTANDPHVRMKEADANREVAKQAAEDRAKHDRAMEDHYIRADATAAERAAGMLGRGGGGASTSGDVKESAETRKAWGEVIKDTQIYKANDMGEDVKDMQATSAAHSLLRTAQSKGLDPYQLQPIIAGAVEQARDEAIRLYGKTPEKLSVAMTKLSERANVIVAEKIGGARVEIDGRIVGVAWDDDDARRLHKMHSKPDAPKKEATEVKAAEPTTPPPKPQDAPVTPPKSIDEQLIPKKLTPAQIDALREEIEILETAKSKVRKPPSGRGIDPVANADYAKKIQDIDAEIGKLKSRLK